MVASSSSSDTSDPYSPYSAPSTPKKDQKTALHRLSPSSPSLQPHHLGAFVPSSSWQEQRDALPVLPVHAVPSALMSPPLSSQASKEGSYLGVGKKTVDVKKVDVWEIVWAAVPILLYAVGIATMGYGMFQRSEPYFKVTSPVDGTVLSMSLFTCELERPGQERMVAYARWSDLSVHCGHLIAQSEVAGTMAGYSYFQLLFSHAQSPRVFVASLTLYGASLLVWLLPWSAAYFPASAQGNGIWSKIVKRGANAWIRMAGVFAFVAFILGITIGIGFRLLLSSTVFNFVRAEQIAILRGLAGVEWKAEVGGPWAVFWVANAMQALSVIATVCALHNHLDERAATGTKGKGGNW